MVRAGWKAQWLRVFTDFLKDMSLFPSTHIGQLTTVCNSSSRGSDNPLLVSSDTTLTWYILRQILHINKTKTLKRHFKKKSLVLLCGSRMNYKLKSQWEWNQRIVFLLDTVFKAQNPRLCGLRRNSCEQMFSTHKICSRPCMLLLGCTGRIIIQRLQAWVSKYG